MLITHSNQIQRTQFQPFLFPAKSHEYNPLQTNKSGPSNQGQVVENPERIRPSSFH
jgi:hypothetical protein